MQGLCRSPMLCPSLKTCHTSRYHLQGPHAMPYPDIVGFSIILSINVSDLPVLKFAMIVIGNLGNDL